MRDGAGLSPLIAAAIVLGASVLALLLPWMPSFRALMLGLDDLLIAALAPAEPQHGDIALVAIDEATLAAAACRSPIDRLLLAGLVERLDAAGVRASGLDVLLDQPTTPEADARLERALRQARAPVVAITAQAGTVMSERQRAWHAGYLSGVPTAAANLAKDRVDGVVRRYRPAGQDGLPSFPSALAVAAGRPDGAGHGLLEIAWHGRPAPDVPPFPVYPADAIAHLPPAWLVGRVVLVGTTLDGVDRHRTPLSLLGPDMPGVEIQAHVLAQLLDGRRLPRPPAWLDRAAVPLAAGGGLLVAAAGLGLPAQLGTALLVPLAMLGLTAGAYAAGGPLAFPLPPVVAWLAAQGTATFALVTRERADRRVLMRLFAHHLSAPIAREIWDERHTFLAGGRPRPQNLTATVLFSDIEGFTAITEALGPEALMLWLEGYLDRMVAVVDRHGGVVLRFIGDAVFAAFGVPVPRTGEDAVVADARRAVACALAMADEVGALNAELAAQGLPRIGIRIGIQTGPMTAGSLGRSAHLEYALMGDAVNTAARLEAYAKTLRGQGAAACTILVGAATRARLGPDVALRAVGEIGLRGKKESVGVFEVIPTSVEALQDAEAYGRVGDATL